MKWPLLQKGILAGYDHHAPQNGSFGGGFGVGLVVERLMLVWHKG